ncbi:MAG TPA: matrixin family metalloprotease [Actinomycetota bacterium]|nr:matrixin family metalloprotease [Actinomycetota bacterium]
MRKRFVGAAVVALVLASFGPGSAAAARDDAYVEPRVGGIYARGFAGPGSYAVLIDVHSVHKAPAPPSGANCSNDGAGSGTYATTGWVIAANRTAHLNPATVPSYLGGVTTALQSSWNAWRVDAGVPSVSVATDGTVTKYTANRLYDILWGKTGGSLATTYTWRWSDGFIESDVVFNNAYTWWQAPSEGDGCYEDAGEVYDVANIATHEFGHAYGLGHPSGARFETMYAYGYSGETLKRSPASGDRAGISALY